MLRLLLILVALSAECQTLSFAPQNTANGVTTWAVVGCGGNVSIARIYALAGEHGIQWLLPVNAALRTKHRSFWSNAARYGGFAAAAASGLIGLKVIQASPAVESGVISGSTLLNFFVPLAKQQAPTIDPTAGSGLVMGPDGCAITSFLAATNGKEKPFSAKLQVLIRITGSGFSIAPDISTEFLQ